MKRICYLLLFTCFYGLSSSFLLAQELQPGFDTKEYTELLKLITASSESAAKAKTIPAPESKLQYRSKEMGLANLWELWMKDQHTAVLCTRGTTGESKSWFANLYAAMVPAQGELHIANDFTFSYQLTSDPKAAVHVGYLISTAFLSRDMLPKIDSCYKADIRDMIITGHSQGGGISYLLTAYFHSLQKEGRLPKDIRFKTYCSAPPKPGNLEFAYAYEKMTQGGWAFHVSNTEDWVPQVPFSVQTVGDFPAVSPVPLVEGIIAKQSFFKRFFGKIMIKKAKKPSEKTVATYQKYLGKGMVKEVKKYLPEFVEPKYAPSNNYVRTGIPIVLYPDANYYEKFKEGEKLDMMLHHSIPPYYYLINHYLDK